MQLLVVSNQPQDPPLPVLELLSHNLTNSTLDTEALSLAQNADCIIIDGRYELAKAKSICQLFISCNSIIPRILVINESACTALTPAWQLQDFVFPDIGPTELETRLRLAAEVVQATPITHGGISIDEEAYTVTLDGKNLDLTYTEFELLRYLVSNPDKVFTRDVLLEEVWGWDYFGGTRTVDVHIRRLRAKLGAEYEATIQTVRNVGYRFSPPSSIK